MQEHRHFSYHQLHAVNSSDDLGFLACIQLTCSAGQKCMIVQTFHFTDVVKSSDARTMLSSIENIWYMGKHCTSTRTQHNINIAHSKPKAEDTLNAQTRLFWNSKLYGNLCIILISSPNTSSSVKLVSLGWVSRLELFAIQHRNHSGRIFFSVHPTCPLESQCSVVLISNGDTILAQIPQNFNAGENCMNIGTVHITA